MELVRILFRLNKTMEAPGINYLPLINNIGPCVHVHVYNTRTHTHTYYQCVLCLSLLTMTMFMGGWIIHGQHK